MGVVAGKAAIRDSERVAWSTGNRAERYREQAGRFEQMAKMEARPRARERLLELAGQYLALADHVADQKTRTAPGPSPTRRGRND